MLLVAAWWVLSLPCLTVAQDQPAVILPPGVKAVWDSAKAFRETTPTRERLCINGLWRWQPATEDARQVPTAAWGYYKVPACWPGSQDYMRSDYQTLYPAPGWMPAKLDEVQSAWYERAITIPQNWAGRRIALDVEYLNSYAEVYVDGRKVGAIRFPAGQVDLSSAVLPGATHVLRLRVVALPLQTVMESYDDTNTGKQKPGGVERRGLCGDVWLIGEPAGARLSNVKIETSFRQNQIAFTAEAQGLADGGQYKLRARISDHSRQVKEFIGPIFTAREVKDGRAIFTTAWKPPKLWDIDTPQNQYDAEVSLLDADDRTLDTAVPVRFGFREFWSQGRDFHLNGARLYLSLVPLDNAQVGAALATYAAARESFERLKSFGINLVYTHNYGCEPGSHLSFTEILRAADDTGMLVALTQPHFSAYDWKTPDADRTNGYARHAAFYARVAGSHPSVVAYAMSHNATGYNEDMNPRLIDGLGDARDPWAVNNANLALRAESIVKRLDPTRIIYHHDSGNLSAVYTLNFYPNFVPSQELDDWFEHWSTVGIKPLVLVEYGAPFGWDWTMYRGWYQGRREFGSAAVPWEYCIAEWNAQFLGDAAYQISDREKANLRWEAQQFRKGRGWFHWDYPYPVGDAKLDELQPVQAAYTRDNWRAFRTWGLSGSSPWEFDRFWKLRDGFQPRRQDLPVDWENLQRPGYSPDFIDRTYARFDLAYQRADWIPTPTAESLLRNNQPLLGWIAGKPEHFTTKDHTFNPGELVEKQLILINNSRRTITCDVSWSADLVPAVGGAGHVVMTPGDQTRIPVELKLPTDVKPGEYQLTASFRFSTGESQEDSFALQVIPRSAPLHLRSRIALFDPAGLTGKLLAGLGVSCQPVGAAADLSGFEVLLIGKGALTVDGPAPVLKPVRDGLKVVVFEQTSKVLERRLGFRVEEYGLRQVWPRVADSPLLAGLKAENLHDWRGSSSLLPPTLNYKLNPQFNGAPTVNWCGLDVTRLWRCGNWGNVASVLIEKPSRGNFLPILDGGYALQYSPLLEYREGRGMVLFCQMDVTARTGSDPAAETLVGNILRYIDAWRPAPQRTAIYAGEPEGLAWLAAGGVEVAPFKGEPPGSDQVLVVGAGVGHELEAQSPAISSWMLAGGRVLALGLDQAEANSFLPGHVAMQTTEHIAAFFPAFSASSLLAGVAPADVHNRDPRSMPLVMGGATLFGDGVLAATGGVVFCQLPPWHFDPSPEHFNQRRTFGRSSFAVSRLLGNLGVSGTTPLLERFSEPVAASQEPSLVRNGDFSVFTGTGKLWLADVRLQPIPDPTNGRWLDGLYVTKPVEWDDPYRFFGW